MNKVYACFPGGKHKALTLSYDDGREADRRLIEIFNQNGIRATFHLNSRLMETAPDRVDKRDVRKLYAGHEVACHTLTHPTIARCPMPEVVDEVLSDRRALEDLVGYPVRGLSYPNGSYSDAIRAMLPHVGIRYARVVGSSDAFSLPNDPYAWQATCHHGHNLLALGDQFLSLHKKQYLYLMYVWGHSYEFDEKENWNLIEDFCARMGGQDDIWYCTNIEFMDCMDAFTALRFSAGNRFVENPNARECWISVNDRAPIAIPGGQTVRLTSEENDT